MKSLVITLTFLMVLGYNYPSYAAGSGCHGFYSARITQPYLMQNDRIRSVSPTGDAVVEISKEGIRVVDLSGRDIIGLMDETALRALKDAPLPTYGLLKRAEFNWSSDGKMVTISSPTATYSGSLVLNLEKGTATTSAYFARPFGEEGLIIAPIAVNERAPEEKSIRTFFRFLKNGPAPALDIRVTDEKGVDRKIILKNAEGAQRAMYGSVATTSNSDSFAFTSGAGKFLVESVNKRNSLQIFNMNLLPNGDIGANFTKAIDLAKLVNLSTRKETDRAYSTANGTLEGAIDNVIARHESINSVNFVTSPTSNKIHALVEIKGDWYQYARVEGTYLSTRIVVVEVDPLNGVAKVLDQPFSERRKEGVRWSEPAWPDFQRLPWATITPATYVSFFIERSASGKSEVYGVTEERNEAGKTLGYTKTLLSSHPL